MATGEIPEAGRGPSRMAPRTKNILKVAIFTGGLLAACPVLVVLCFLVYADITVFGDIHHRIDSVDGDPKSVAPSAEFVDVLGRAKDRHLYWDVVATDLREAMAATDAEGWQEYGMACHLLAFLRVSKPDAAKYIANSARTDKGQGLQEYSLGRFHHGLDSLSCKESAEVEAITYSHVEQIQTQRRILIEREICTKPE